MPGRGLVVARALALGLVLGLALGSALGLAAAGANPAAADSGIDPAGQVFLTFKFGGDKVKSSGPRLGLRLGLQGGLAAGDPESEPFTSAMSLRFGMAGPAEVSIGGLTLPFGFGQSDLAADDSATAGYATRGSAVVPGLLEPEPLVTAAGPDNWPSQPPYDSPVAPNSAAQNNAAPDTGVPDTGVPDTGAPATAAPPTAKTQTTATGTGPWQFRVLQPVATGAPNGRGTKTADFVLRSVDWANTAGRPTGVPRGSWRFQAWTPGPERPDAAALAHLVARMLLPRELTAQRRLQQGARLQQVPRSRTAQPQARQPETGQTNAVAIGPADAGSRPSQWVFRKIDRASG